MGPLAVPLPRMKRSARSGPARPHRGSPARCPRPAEESSLHPRGGVEDPPPTTRKGSAGESPTRTNEDQENQPRGPAGLPSRGRVGANRPGGRGDMAPERAGTERPERRVETLAPTERFYAREGNSEGPHADLASSVARGGGSEGRARCAARATPPSARGAKQKASTQWKKPALRRAARETAPSARGARRESLHAVEECVHRRTPAAPCQARAGCPNRSSSTRRNPAPNSGCCSAISTVARRKSALLPASKRRPGNVHA